MCIRKKERESKRVREWERACERERSKNVLHSGSNQPFYPTFHSSYTRCIIKSQKNHKNLSKSHSGSKQAFAPHFILLRPAVFLKLSRERERNLKICLSLTAGLSKLLPYISFLLDPLYKKIDLKNLSKSHSGYNKAFAPHALQFRPAVL